MKIIALFFVLVFAVMTIAIVSADEAEEKTKNSLRALSEAQADSKESRGDDLPDTIPVTNKTPDEKAAFAGKIQRCKALYIYLSGCTDAFRMYVKGNPSDVVFGTKGGVGDFPTHVAQHASKHKLFWNSFKSRYWVHLFDPLTLEGVKNINKGSAFQVTPNFPLRLIDDSTGTTIIYEFYANTNLCANNFDFHQTQTVVGGKKVYIESCV